jgi:subtilisin-like proprotein convertase family protein
MKATCTLSIAALLLTHALLRAQTGSVGIGTTAPQAQLHTTASVRHDTLAGVGQRPVFADASGKLFTPQATFLSNNTVLPIPDNGCGAVPNGAASTITYSGTPFIATSARIKVRVNLQHGGMSQVTLYLQSPGGQVLRLMSNTSGAGLNDVVFSDGALGTVPSASNVIHSGHYRPTGGTASACGITPNIATFGAFGSYNAIDPSGTWTLRAYDNAQYTAGTIQSWSISFDGSDPLPSQVISSGIVPRGTSGGGLTNGTLFDAGGAIGLGTQTPHAPLQFASSSALRKLVLYEHFNNDNQFTGFGNWFGSLYYQVPNDYSDHVFYRGTNAGTSTELFRVNGNGYVGIGNSSPHAPLQFSNSASLRKIVLQENANNDFQFVGFGITAGDDLRYHTASASGDHVFSSGSGSTTSTELVRITGEGLVGIGTSSPGTKAKVEIWGGAWATPYNYRYMNPSSDGNISGNTTANHYSLFTNDRIWCGGEINVTSDARTKTRISSSLPSSDLALVNRLRVVDYSYVDRVTKGDTRVKGFLAQEVEAVMPEAISHNTGVIPNIYAKAERVQYDASASTLAVTMKAAHGLKVGDTLKLITDGGEALVPVVMVGDSLRFTVGEWTKSTEWAFVYGTQVHDLRNLDYNKIFSAGISAIQELSREVTNLTKRMAAAEMSTGDARREMAELRTQVERLLAAQLTAQR